jgi:hypothetical protein
VFWTADGSLSFCAQKADFEDHLRGAGLAFARFEPIADETVTWFETARRSVFAALAALGAKSPPPAERIAKLQHLVLELDNSIRNTREERLIPFFGEARLETDS